VHKKIIDDLYDVIIVGGGVAGLAGAITAGQMDLRALLLEKAVFGGSVAVLETIDEYPGVEKIGGWELTQTMVKQARNSGCLLFDSKEVTGLQAEDDSRFVKMKHALHRRESTPVPNVREQGIKAGKLSLRARADLQ
jgi:thioredoxin reductase